MDTYIRNAKRRGRSYKGSAITEFAPAIFLLFIAIMFPMINLISIGLAYMNGQWLHDRLLREAGLSVIITEDDTTTPPKVTNKDMSCCTSSSDSKLGKLITAWKASGVGQFAHLAADPVQETTFDPLEGSKTAQYIHVKTTLQVNPFLNIPFPGVVPGINAPMSFTYAGRSVVENVRNYQMP